jgi:PhzF family phenazine biosynthesis protein
LKYKIYQVDAFSDKVFGGNPAAVIVLKEWMDESLMQNIAAENNLSETAFVVPKDDDYEIRWFTPNMEVALCGHATLASAYVLFNYYNHPTDKIIFQSRERGELYVTKNGDRLSLNFPADSFEKVETPRLLIDAFGKQPLETYKGKTDYALVYSSQKEIESAHPDFGLIAKSGARGVMITAPGNEVDFVSRFFAPLAGVNEDPVTGSAHTTLTPIWSEKFGKAKLTARQLSKRMGDLQCELIGDRVIISGYAVTYLTGEIII